MAKYQGRTVKLGNLLEHQTKVKNLLFMSKIRKTGNVKKVRFGDPRMSIKSNIPARKGRFLLEWAES